MDSSPPKYEKAHGGDLKVVHIGSTLPATAALTPILVLNQPKIGYTITKKKTEKGHGPFNFHINNLANGVSVFEGEVTYDQTATITGTGSGDPFTIEIKKVKTPVNVKNSCTFDVVKGVVSMATIIVHKSKKEVVINSSASGRDYVADEVPLHWFSETCSFLIKKDGGTAARIEFPDLKNYEPFECILEFYPTGQPITEMEKQLFISVAVICMMVRSGPILTKLELTFWIALCKTLAFGIIVGVGVGFGVGAWFLFDYLIRL